MSSSREEVDCVAKRLALLLPAVMQQSDPVNEAGYPSTVVMPTTTRVVDGPGMCGVISAKVAGA